MRLGVMERIAIDVVAVEEEAFFGSSFVAAIMVEWHLHSGNPTAFPASNGRIEGTALTDLAQAANMISADFCSTGVDCEWLLSLFRLAHSTHRKAQDFRRAS